MNAFNMKEIVISHGKAQEDFIRELKRLAQRLIGEQYEAVYDFFCDVLEHESMYKIIRARRCQVLFELFCPIIMLEDEVRPTGKFFSSNAIERHLDELRREDVSILIVDDVLIHGRGLRFLYERFDPDYSRDNIQVAIFCRAVSAACLNEHLESRILRGYLTAFDYEWREISCRFVDFIESSAIPYESFAGGLLSFSKPAPLPEGDKFLFIDNSERSRIFFETCVQSPFLRQIGYDMCLRTYSSNPSGPFFFVPYVFLKNIKKSRCGDLFSFVAGQLDQVRCHHIIDELLACDATGAIYRMRLFSSLVNRIYGLYLTHTYGIMAGACPTRINMELCFGHEVAVELADLDWQDVSALLGLTPPYEEGSIQEDAELSGSLLMPDDCEDDMMYRSLSMYYYINGRLEEQTLEKQELRRRDGLTIGHFYHAADPRFCHELTAAQIRCWDLGQASGIMQLSGETEDCIAMYGVAGEQNFRFILEENRDYFKKRNKDYTLEFSGLKDDSDDGPDDSDDRTGGGASGSFAGRNRELLERFLHDNEDRLEEWYIPQFIS